MTHSVPTRGSTASSRTIAVVGGLLLAVLATSGAAALATAPHNQTAKLSGTWHVTRTCTSGCYGTSSMTEAVKAIRTSVFTASGSSTMVLYKLGPDKVLVHSALSSSMLTIRVAGQRMNGKGVDHQGNTFQTTWTCIAAPRAGRRVIREIVGSARAIC